jgi:hypothetical protein
MTIIPTLAAPFEKNRISQRCKFDLVSTQS